MRARVLDSAYILNFVDIGFNGEEVRTLAQQYAEKFTSQIFSQKLIDWEVTFRFRYNNTKQILIYLKERSYPIEKYKEIIIHIPIPIISNTSWGVSLKQHVYKDENHLDSLINNFQILDIDYSKFENRQDYILNCMQRAISHCFNYGFTINGVKVKI